MKVNRFLVICLAFFLVHVSVKAQNPIIKNREYPQGYFRSPLDIPPQASGTFGELRSTHFHAGDDYRTQQRVGLPLFAVAEGYVARVRVQIGGGGNSVYINHPNGFTSVYLHMHEFNAQLAAIVKAKQYELQRFDVDISLEEAVVPVRKGDRIGLAGNTGSSQGPHLHFEIRDTKTEAPLNPQLFGLKFPDNLAPLIRGITVYDLADEPFSEHTPRRHLSLQSAQVLPVNGRFGVGINTVDRHNGTSFNNGVYSIELLLDGRPVSTVLFEELSFATSGTIHSYIDYPYYILKKTRIQKSFKDPNNPINIFHFLEGDGSITLTDNQEHTLTYRVRDVHGNTSTHTFKVRNTPSYTPVRQRAPGTAMFSFDSENRFTAEHAEVIMPENALYDHLHFNYHQGSRPKGGYSMMQHIHNRFIPLRESYELKIKPDSTLTDALKPKAIIVNAEGNSHGGNFEDGWVRTKTRSFGGFYIAVDTLPPTIQPQNISENKNMAATNRINFKISDNLSGIQSFNGYIDDQWVLMEYDPKSRSLWHTLESDLQKGKHRFRLEVVDWKDNKQVYEVNFIR
ncbi:M23 family metallopeptidase [Parapedobacter sp. ISTM3]|uniref:M23 family metallopeptidase n=1 Tax=Parapedobacter sp. ISTM3 TaxID=2800130 RepID=UPI001906DCF0|nr:M23 family metallopeptidase [Parapedobacter sp. ISTM3]MBK1440070.1 M23 family metallopeptidase [Parapedobacter sp. ISTM3]